MADITLKPCPFCGGEAMLTNTVSFGEPCKAVWCIRCKARTENHSATDQARQYDEGKSAMYAARAWNRRVNDER